MTRHGGNCTGAIRVEWYAYELHEPFGHRRLDGRAAGAGGSQRHRHGERGGGASQAAGPHLPLGVGRSPQEVRIPQEVGLGVGRGRHVADRPAAVSRRAQGQVGGQRHPSPAGGWEPGGRRTGLHRSRAVLAGNLRCGARLVHAGGRKLQVIYNFLHVWRTRSFHATAALSPVLQRCSGL